MDARCHAVVMTVENQKETKKKERDRGTVGGPQPTRETQEHRVTNTHFAAAPSAYSCSCRKCDFLGRMVLPIKTAPTKFLCWCLLWFAKRRDFVAFLRCKHTPQAIGPAAAKTQQRRAPSTLAAAVSRGQGLYCCLLLCVLGLSLIHI